MRRAPRRRSRRHARRRNNGRPSATAGGPWAACHEQPLRVTYKMALTISRLECSSGRPPGPFPFTWGSRGSTIAHWRSVRSLGYSALRRHNEQVHHATAGDREIRLRVHSRGLREGFPNFFPHYGRTVPSNELDRPMSYEYGHLDKISTGWGSRISFPGSGSVTRHDPLRRGLIERPRAVERTNGFPSQQVAHPCIARARVDERGGTTCPEGSQTVPVMV